jgi:sialate O-acetylesterase
MSWLHGYKMEYIDAMKQSPHFGLILATMLMAVSPVLAEVKLPPHFSDHMVLQRDRKVPIWGTATPGEQVAVNFANQNKRTRAAADGKWRVYLDPLTASGESRVMTISGSTKNDEVRFADVLVGEVWLCSGQSNMDFTVAKTEKYYFAGVNNEAAEIALANYPHIRMFTGQWAKRYEPQAEVAGSWKVTTPENVREFSAIGYFFARELQKQIKVPIGIITLTFGASTAQAWIRRETIATSPELKPLLDKFDDEVKAYETDGAAREKHRQALQAWEADAAVAKAAGNPTPRRPRNPHPVEDQHNPTVMYNGMIAPVVPYALRGVLWYQGESITGPRQLFPLWNGMLITDWRKLWGRDDLPFLFVQLAAYKAPVAEPAESSIAAVREMQAMALGLPHTGMAVTIDIGDEKDVHPHNKQDVGSRLARIAVAKTYGHRIEYSGPSYESMKVEGGAVRLKFSHVGGGLVAKGGPLRYFAIAGADKKFVWAEARIEGESVVVLNPSVSAPVAVRYAWADNPLGCNLYNVAGLPAAPFRTDK